MDNVTKLTKGQSVEHDSGQFQEKKSSLNLREDAGIHGNISAKNNVSSRRKCMSEESIFNTAQRNVKHSKTSASTMKGTNH